MSEATEERACASTASVVFALGDDGKVHAYVDLAGAFMDMAGNASGDLFDQVTGSELLQIAESITSRTLEVIY